ncbi:lipase member H-A-like [Apis laboriosa]|uniref:lipase member H-A-like n=1 Tax=Apis laboriosa TaxID=183418 RepID=UPI001CC7573E|nr:lipase member H-A-like [Apis laboriosa]
MGNIHLSFFLLFLTFLSTNATFTTKNVFLRLYNRNGSHIDKNIKNTDELLPYIQKDNNLVIYITGYTSNIDSDNVKLIINAYLNNTQDNILALDYRDITQHLYPISVLAINQLGTIVANALNTLIDGDVNEKKIHLIGHSLGAHVAGKIGRKTKFKIPRITALDPAGPLFYIFNSRLNSFDANFVDVIHTDSYILGLSKQLGHVDFYPNNGRRPQPGCPLISTLFFNATNVINKNLDITKNVFLRLYKRDGSHIDKNVRNADQLLSHIQKNNSLAFYITGYRHDINSDNVKMVTNAYLKNTQDNILALDYRDIAAQFYPISVVTMKKLSTLVADALNNLVKGGVDAEKIHVIGYSLGAQIAGRIGRQTIFRIPRITGLDPAGPLFYLLNDRLSTSDAVFVDVIHTDKTGYGTALKVGHVDFYPNYGHRPQPGCPLFGLLLSPKDLCSHRRSFEFYAESIRNNTAFIGKCTNFQVWGCDGVPFIPMGYTTPNNATGSYNLLTNENSPYGRGVDGAINAF